MSTSAHSAEVFQSNEADAGTIISPRRGWHALELKELWRFRQLLVILAMRDVRVRYKQTLLGAVWAIIQPISQMIVFTLFFAHHGFSTDNIPAPVFYFAGLVPWQFFSSSLSGAANSIVDNQGLITKVYFPRLLIPIAAVGSSFVDFCLSFSMLLILIVWYGLSPTVTILLIPVFVIMAMISSLSVGLWLSALNARYRDVRYVIPFLVQFWLFVTPVIYPSSMVSPRKRFLLSLNPMSGVVEGFRSCLFGRPLPTGTLLVSGAVICVLFAGGLFFFRRMEDTFADRL